MRVFFFLILLIGTAIGIGYPYVILNFSAHDIGKWRVYDAVTGSLPAHPQLTENDAPLRVVVDMTTTGARNLPSEQAVLTLTASSGGRTVLAEALSFSDATPREVNPQTQERVFRDTAGILDTVASGDYLFTLGLGDAEGISIRYVDLILRREPILDERLQPAGFALMAVGFIGFVLAMRRGGKAENPNSQPPRPRWGRGGGER